MTALIFRTVDRGFVVLKNCLFEKKTAKVILILSALCVTSTGCGLLNTKKGPNIEEAPPYYGKSKEMNVPMEHPYMQREPLPSKQSVSSKSELEKLHEEAELFAEEKKREKGIEKERTEKKKKGFWAWLGSGSKTSLMSDEAKEIHQSLEAKRIDSSLQR